MKISDLTFEPAFMSRSGAFQICHGNIGDRYICTVWTRFPRMFSDKEVSESFRFCANTVPRGVRRSLLHGFNIEDCPYEDGLSFFICESELEADRFLASELFEKTYKP